VRLGIYDAAGRLVARLLRDVAVASPMEVRWDGRNLQGERVAPGTYFYRATGAGAMTGGRIVVLR
jgi:flagellar hook assembly protein FlgD